MFRLLVWVCALAALTVGCGEDLPAAPDASVEGWRCPATWVRHARGGCGPAVLLCVPDGGAAAGACEGVDLSRPPTVDDGDGGAATGFWRAPDGAVRGAWKEPGEPGGPPAPDWHPPALDGLEQRVPAADWVPDAGIPTCPEGWARTDDGVCDPRLPTDCPEGSGPLPGGRCTRTALRDCPAGEYADPGAEAVGAQVLHVREGADDARADGSVARPYGTINAALAAATEGAWVLVAAGEYAERPRFTRSVHLVGVCAARATVAEPTPADPMRALLALAPGTRVEVRDFTLRGGVTALGVSGGARADVHRVAVQGAASAAVASDPGSVVTIEDLFHDASDAPVASPLPYSIFAARGGRAELAHAYVARHVRLGALCEGEGSALSIRDSLIRAGRSATPGGTAAGAAVAAATRCAARAERVVAVQNQNVAFLANGPAARLAVEDVVAQRTRAAEGFGGIGLFASNGASLEARRAFVSESQSHGVAAHNRAYLRVAESVVRATDEGFEATGTNLAAAFGGQLDAYRVIASRAHGTGVGAWGAGTTLTLDECVVRDTLTDRSTGTGVGVLANTAALVRVRRTAVAGSAVVGVQALVGGRVSAAFVRVSDSNGVPGSFSGRGLEAFSARIEASGVRITGVRGNALLASDPGGVLQVEDVWMTPPPELGEWRAALGQLGGWVSAQRALAEEGFPSGAVALGGRVTLRDVSLGDAPRGVSGGAALAAAQGGRIEADRVRAECGRGVGVLVRDAGSRAEVRDAVLAGPRAGDDAAGEAGALAEPGTAIALTRVLIAGTPRAGVVAQGELTLEDSVVAAVRPGATGTDGVGVSVQGGAARLRRVVVRGCNGFGVLAAGRATVDAADLAVLDTASVFDGTDSAAVGLLDGARATLARALFARNAHSAVIARDVGTRLTAADLLVEDTRATRLGFGVGVGAAEGAAVAVTRGAVVRAGGFAVGAVRQRVGGASLTVADLYVAGVADRAVRNTFPQGPPVAYGIAVGASCGAVAERALVVDSGWGFFQTAGTLRWREGLVVDARDGPGAVSGLADPAASTLEGVRFVGGATSSVARDLALPEVLLPPPPTACALPPCMRP